MPVGYSLGVFAAFSLLLAGLLLLAPGRRGEAAWQSVLRTLLPAVLLGALMLGAWWTQSGTRLTAQISAFRIPAAAAPIDPQPELLFRVGDRTEAADLVVKPYQKDHLNRLFDGDDPRTFVEVLGARDPADPTRLSVRLVLHEYTGSAADDIPGMRLTLNQDDPCTTAFAPRRVMQLPPGKKTVVHIYRDDNEGRCGTRQTRYQERREFTVRHVAATRSQDARIEIALPAGKAMRADAGTCTNPRDILLPAPAAGAQAPGYLMPRNLEFSGLGYGGHSRAVMRGEAIGPAADGVKRCDKAFQVVNWPSGDNSARTSLTLGFAFLTLPWLLLWLMTAMTGACLVLGLAAQRLSLAERVLVPTVLYLVALRAMVAIAGAAYDASFDPDTFTRDAAVAIIFVPPLLIALIRPAELADRRLWLLWIGFAAGLLGIALYWLRSTALEADQWLFVAAVVGLLAVRAGFERVQPVAWAFAGIGRIALEEDVADRIAARLPRWAWLQALFNVAAGIVRAASDVVMAGVNRVRAWTKPRIERPRRHALGGLALALVAAPLWYASRSDFALQHLWLAATLIALAAGVATLGGIVVARQILPAALLDQSRAYRIGVLLLLVMGFSRLLAIGLGWQERIMGFPISIVYLPALFAATALLVIGLARFRQMAFWGSLVAAGALFFAGIFAPIMARDTGFVLVHTMPIAIVAATYLRRSTAESTTRRWAIGAVCAPIMALIAVLLLQSWSAATQVPDAGAGEERAQAATIAEAMNGALDFNANGLRLLQIVKPSAVEQIGTRDGYDQMEQTAMLHSLTDTLTGAGWLAPVELLSMRKEQTWDYVSAIHLMYPFGRIGVVCFLAVLIAAAMALGARLLPGEALSVELPARAMFARMIGAMAVLTLPFSAAYMVLCNLLLIPFTGRDIYLLGVRSTGDMIEGVLLLAMMALAVLPVEDKA